MTSAARSVTVPSLRGQGSSAGDAERRRFLHDFRLRRPQRPQTEGSAGTLPGPARVRLAGYLGLNRHWVAVILAKGNGGKGATWGPTALRTSPLIIDPLDQLQLHACFVRLVLAPPLGAHTACACAFSSFASLSLVFVLFLGARCMQLALFAFRSPLARRFA